MLVVTSLAHSSLSVNPRLKKWIDDKEEERKKRKRGGNKEKKQKPKKKWKCEKETKLFVTEKLNNNINNQ